MKSPGILLAGVMLMSVCISCKNHRVRELEDHLGFELAADSVTANIESRSEIDNSGYFINIYSLTANEIQMIVDDRSWQMLPSACRNPRLNLILNSEAEYRYKYIRTDRTELVADIDNKQIIYSKVFE